MIKRHWEGVINAATTDVTNARAEAINSRIQWVKRMACGYRNRENFRNAVYFHLGGRAERLTALSILAVLVAARGIPSAGR